VRGRASQNARARSIPRARGEHVRARPRLGTRTLVFVDFAVVALCRNKIGDPRPRASRADYVLLFRRWPLILFVPMLFILAIGGLLSSGRISLNTHERPHDTETVPKRERKREREREREREGLTDSGDSRRCPFGGTRQKCIRDAHGASVISCGDFQWTIVA